MVDVNVSITYKVATCLSDKIPAQAFIEMWGQKWHGCSPPKTEGDIIVAYEEDEVVGTVSLDFADTCTIFPLEKLYNFSHVRNYFPDLERRHLVQGGRWFASRPNISRELLHVIAEYCIPHGAQYMIAEVKETSIKRLEELGIQFAILYGIAPSLEVVPPEGLKYYRDMPIPRLMLIKLSVMLIPGKSILQH